MYYWACLKFIGKFHDFSRMFKKHALFRKVSCMKCTIYSQSCPLKTSYLWVHFFLPKSEPSINSFDDHLYLCPKRSMEFYLLRNDSFVLKCAIHRNNKLFFSKPTFWKCFDVTILKKYINQCQGNLLKREIWS